eukprot:m51a1_g4118 putative glycogenin-1-like isoform x1 (1095) ;mRNA; r:150150-156245
MLNAAFDASNWRHGVDQSAFDVAVDELQACGNTPQIGQCGAAEYYRSHVRSLLDFVNSLDGHVAGMFREEMRRSERRAMCAMDDMSAGRSALAQARLVTLVLPKTTCDEDVSAETVSALRTQHVERIINRAVGAFCKNKAALLSLQSELIMVSDLADPRSRTPESESLFRTVVALADKAFVFLVISDPYVRLALGLEAGLRAVGSSELCVALVGPKVGEGAVGVLQLSGMRVLPIPESPRHRNYRPPGNRWTDLLSKLEAFRVPVRRVVFMDVDTVLFGSPDDLFDRKEPQDNWGCYIERPGKVNSGLMSFRYDPETYGGMMRLLDKQVIKNGDQELVQRYWESYIGHNVTTLPDSYSTFHTRFSNKRKCRWVDQSFRFSPSSSRRSRDEAYVFLVLSDSYVRLALGLEAGLRAVGSSRPCVVLVGPRVGAGAVEVLQHRNYRPYDPRWADLLSKLEAFRVPVRRTVFMDVDTVLFGSPDDLFDRREPFVASQDNWGCDTARPGTVNSGLMSIAYDSAAFGGMLGVLERQVITNGDQEIVQRYWEKRIGNVTTLPDNYSTFHTRFSDRRKCRWVDQSFRNAKIVHLAAANVDWEQVARYGNATPGLRHWEKPFMQMFKQQNDRAGRRMLALVQHSESPAGAQLRDSLYCGAHGRHVWALVWGVLAMASTCGQGLYLNGWYVDHGYKSYYILCWFTQSFLMIVFPLWFFGEVLVGGAKNCSKEGSWGLRAFSAGAARQAGESLRQCKKVFVPSEAEGCSQTKGEKAKKIAFRITMWCLMAASNFFSSYCWYWSYAYVTVTANQALYSTLNVFVFLICAVFKAERVTLPKVVAVLVSLAGSVILCLSPEAARPADDPSSSGGTEPISPGRWAAGCVLVIVSAFTYSIFEICYQKGVGLRDARIVVLSQSAMGLFVCTVLWIPMLIVFETHAEPVPPVGDPSNPVVPFLFVNVAFAVWYYVSYAFGITTGEPTYITIFTTIVSIIIAVIMDRCQNGIVPSSSQGWGIGVLVLGALLSNIRNIKRVPIVDLDLIEWSRQVLCGKKKKEAPEEATLPSQVPPVESPVPENRVEEEVPASQDEPTSVVVAPDVGNEHKTE